jgi:hypothetical protein
MLLLDQEIGLGMGAEGRCGGYIYTSRQHTSAYKPTRVRFNPTMGFSEVV